MFGSAVTAQGEGELEGRTVTLSYITTVGTNGKSVLVLSEDGETMSGSFTDLVTGMTMPLSLAREASGADIFTLP